MRKQNRSLKFRQNASNILLALAVGVVIAILVAPAVVPPEWLTLTNVSYACLAVVALAVVARAVRPFRRQELMG